MDDSYISTVMSSAYQTKFVNGIVKGATNVFPATTVMSRTDIIRELTSRPEALVITDANIPTKESVKRISDEVYFEDRDAVAKMLVQYLTTKSYSANPRNWVRAITAKEEKLSGKMVLPLIDVVVAERGQVKELREGTFLAEGNGGFDRQDSLGPKAYFVFMLNGELTAITPEGRVFNPQTIQYSQDVLKRAKAELAAKSITERKGEFAGVVLIITPDAMANGEKEIIETMSRLLIETSRSIEARIAGRELTAGERGELPFNYRLGIFVEEPIYMFERDAMSGESRAHSHYLLKKIFDSNNAGGYTGDETIDKYSPIIYMGAKVTVSKITDTSRGLEVIFSNNSKTSGLNI